MKPISSPFLHLRSCHDSPSTNLVISVTGEESLTISRPSQRYTFGISCLLVGVAVEEIGLELIDLGLLLEIEDGDGGSGGGAEPVSVRREDESVDLIAGL